MSRSTLRRRLREQGTTLRALLQEVRQDHALRYLRQQDVSIDEIAYLVGYDDSTAFHKAFRKWTGATPAELRARMRPNLGANTDKVTRSARKSSRPKWKQTR
jgi:AraC-like DNA-binding protein